MKIQILTPVRSLTCSKDQIFILTNDFVYIFDLEGKLLSIISDISSKTSAIAFDDK